MTPTNKPGEVGVPERWEIGSDPLTVCCPRGALFLCYHPKDAEIAVLEHNALLDAYRARGEEIEELDESATYLSKVRDDQRELIDALRSDLARAVADAKGLRERLEATLGVYVELVNSGDAGNWNPETEEHVIAARAALKSAPPATKET